MFKTASRCLALSFPYTSDLEITNFTSIFPRITKGGPFEVSLLRGLVKDHPQALILLSLRVLSHTSLQLSVKSQYHLEEPVSSSHETTHGCMQNNRWPGKAINIQKGKAEEGGRASECLQARFKPILLKLKASELPDEGTCQ